MIAWFADNSVAANLLMAVIIIAGLLTVPRVRREVFPEFELDFVTVTVPYPGAAPEEIEKSITSRIEDRVASIEGVEKITSSAAEDFGTVLIEAMPGSDILELLDEVKTAVDAIDTFPEEAEEPSIRRVVARHHVLSIAIHGHSADEAALKHLGERVRDDLAALPEITQVELTNARPYEIAIEVSESALRSYGLTFDDVAQAVRRSSLDLPGGSVKTAAGEVLLRTQGQAYQGGEFEDIVLRTRADGTRLYVRDVATVVDGFEDSDQKARFDGDPAVMVAVYRVGEQSALAISAAARAYVEAHAASLPPGIFMTPWNDESSVLRDRLEMLGRNGLQGLVLVFLTLAIFLQFRLAVWTSVGIPLSFLGAVWLMPSLGVSINILSLFSFILVLGIVVDDAIVVGENVFKKKEEGLRGLDAAVQGTQEVAIPVIFGVLTTVAVFFPMLVIPGITGNIMKTFPLIVIPTLLFSLVESQLILPAHLKHVVVDGVSRRGIFGVWKRFQHGASRGLRRVIDGLYRPTLKWALEWRYTVAAVGLVFLAISTAVLATGRLRMRFFPDAEADFVVANLTMPLGTPVSITEEALAQLEAAALAVREHYDADKDPDATSSVRHMMVAVADQPFFQGHGPRRANLGSHVGQMILQLAPAEARSFSSGEMANRWRELTGA
ncbi:MAG: efflux RND transporter permease subunit, partial [Dehalococcoidia bacterium]